MKTPLRLAGRLWLPLFVLVLAANARAQGGEDIDVQTSGPVHEGFANPTVFEDSTEPYYVDVDPPTLIEESPPLERPSSTEWVHGYWAWEDESNQWMWISGTWRATPPGYVWVSGYWIKTWKGWRYVRGYWAPVGYGTGEIEYLPAPPHTLEAGPIGYAPWPNAIWVPGTWIWVSGGYLGWMWQSGYWIAWNPDWTWVPATYAWTPYGYIFIPGHYDHSCDTRGYLYAPVVFPRRSYLTLGFAYSPSFVINITLFSGVFFTRPAYHHYYFGDYYAQTHWNRGIYPAFSFQYSKHGYDPIFAHATVKYGKTNPKWTEVQRSEYLVRRDDVSKRPARTLREQNSRAGLQIAVAARDADDKATLLKKENVPDSGRVKLIAEAKEMRHARQERVKGEAANGQGGDKLPDNPRRLKSQGFVPGFKSAKAKETEAVVVTPKKPDIPKAVAEDKNLGDRQTGPNRPKRLRDPSLDLPVEGAKPGNDTPTKKPVDDVPAKKPGDDVPGRRPPFTKPGDDTPTKKPVDHAAKKPADDTPTKKPADDVPTKKPGNDVPGRRPPFTKPGDDTPTKKPVDDVPAKKPADDTPTKKPGDDVPGRRPPVTKPGDDTPAKKPGDDAPARKPADDAPTKKPADDTPTRKPDVIRPPARKPDDNPPAKKPDEGQPPTRKPEDLGGRRPPTKKPDEVQPPGKKPEEGQPGKKPEDSGKRPAGGQPQPTPKPGERRVVKPGEEPESQPVKKPKNEKERQ